MNIYEIDFRPGRLVYLDWDIEPEQPLNKQIDSLKEDLIQVEFPCNLILDVGWYLSSSIGGSFHVYVIHNYDWESPVFSTTATSLKALDDEIRTAIDFCREYMSKNFS
ncbi:MAG: hypothetical protein AAF639_15250 [Chloroflexota bacterium]